MRALLLTLLIGFAANAADKSVSLKVAGWHSKGDAFKTEEAVRGVKGVKSVKSDVAAKRLEVTFDDAVSSSAAIVKVVADAGYTATQ
jgi:copper chaperone CopZ